MGNILDTTILKKDDLLIYHNPNIITYTLIIRFIKLIDPHKSQYQNIINSNKSEYFHFTGIIVLTDNIDRDPEDPDYYYYGPERNLTYNKKDLWQLF